MAAYSPLRRMQARTAKADDHFIAKFRGFDTSTEPVERFRETLSSPMGCHTIRSGRQRSSIIERRPGPGDHVCLASSPLFRPGPGKSGEKKRQNSHTAAACLRDAENVDWPSVASGGKELRTSPSSWESSSVQLFVQLSRYNQLESLSKRLTESVLFLSVDSRIVFRIRKKMDIHPSRARAAPGSMAGYSG